VAITDVNSVAGIVRAHQAAKQAGIKLCVGARLRFADAPDVLVWVQNRGGYANLCRLLTLGKRRAEKGACILRLDDLLGFLRRIAGRAGPAASIRKRRLPIMKHCNPPRCSSRRRWETACRWRFRACTTDLDRPLLHRVQSVGRALRRSAAGDQSGALSRRAAADAAGRAGVHSPRLHDSAGWISDFFQRRAISQNAARNAPSVRRSPRGPASNASRSPGAAPFRWMNCATNIPMKLCRPEKRRCNIWPNLPGPGRGSLSRRRSAESAAADRARTQTHRGNQRRGVFSDRLRSGALRPLARHPLPGARIGGQFRGLLLHRRDQRRSRPHRRAV
jgi:hypothetical protein